MSNTASGTSTISIGNRQVVNCGFEVTDDGIQKNYADGTAKIIIPKEVFIEAYNRYIVNNTASGTPI